MRTLLALVGSRGTRDQRIYRFVRFALDVRISKRLIPMTIVYNSSAECSSAKAQAAIDWPRP